MHRTGPEEDCKVFSKQTCLTQKGGLPAVGLGRVKRGGRWGWGEGVETDLLLASDITGEMKMPITVT